jgi:F-type H+-transporting ATPase subunit b
MLHLFVLAAEEEAKNPILPDIAELIYGTIAFAIVFGLLWKFAFPAINKMLAERSDKIQGNLERAEHSRQAAEQELAEYRAQLAGAREEANRISSPGDCGRMRRDVRRTPSRRHRRSSLARRRRLRAERDRVFRTFARRPRHRRRARRPGGRAVARP